MTTTSQHTARMELTVGQVAESFGVTVRTLHHYDAVGLVVPSARTHAGYRLYGYDDLARLATVVTYRDSACPSTRSRPCSTATARRCSTSSASAPRS